MGNQLDFERYFWFHSRLKSNLYPSKKQMMEKFGIEERTAQRAITFMKDRLKAPILYSRAEGGYYYSDKSYEFPNTRFTEREIMAILVTDCLAHTIPDKNILKENEAFLKKVSYKTGIDVSRLKSKISIKNIRYEKVQPEIFENVIESLDKNTKIVIEYSAGSTRETTCRTINPLHLLLYKGNWYLFAFCEKRNELRNFSLSRILSIKRLNDKVPENLHSINIEELIEHNYGIYIREKESLREEVKLKFDSLVAESVKNQIWFPLQDLEECADGSIILKFFVTDFRELISDILRYGEHIEVLAPSTLRDHLKQIINKMGMLY